MAIAKAGGKVKISGFESSAADSSSKRTRFIEYQGQVDCIFNSSMCIQSYGISHIPEKQLLVNNYQLTCVKLRHVESACMVV